MIVLLKLQYFLLKNYYLYLSIIIIFNLLKRYIFKNLINNLLLIPFLFNLFKS